MAQDRDPSNVQISAALEHNPKSVVMVVILYVDDADRLQASLQSSELVGSVIPLEDCTKLVRGLVDMAHAKASAGGGH